MAPSSQTFSQGGILSSDWFSDTLNNHTNIWTCLVQSKTSWKCEVVVDYTTKGSSVGVVVQIMISPLVAMMIVQRNQAATIPFC